MTLPRGKKPMKIADARLRAFELLVLADLAEASLASTDGTSHAR